MELTKIEIENYKSIAEPITIAFYKGLPSVLVGKNGSGKSNILEAIEHIASTNSNFPGKYSSEGLNYKAYIRMDSCEFANLFPNEEYSEEKATFIAYSSEKGGLHINTIESDTIVPLLKKEFYNVLELVNQLESAVEDYEKALKKIACGDGDLLEIQGYDIVDAKGSTTNYIVLKSQTEILTNQLKQLVCSLTSNLKSENTFVFSLPYYRVKWYLPHTELTPFKLRYKEPELALFEQKFITINKSAIKREITKINKKTESACQNIEEILNKLKIQFERLADTDYCGVVTDFVRKVSKIFGNNSGYLLSENSQVLFKDYRKENDNRYYDSSHVILEAYAKYKNKDTIFKDKDYVFTDRDVKEFEEWLNDNRPMFDEGMYSKITVSVNEKNKFTISLCENNGQKISLNETSAGRRWYFTYYFVKNTLSSGDTFIIDEPASMLHPSAQKEILSDILEMTNRGIRVIYSTHSPYLIPDNWNCIGFVNMSDKTQVSYVDTKNERKTVLKTIAGDIFDLETILEVFQKSVPETVAENCYQAIKKKERTIEHAAKELDLSEDTIKSWHRKGEHFRAPKFENVIKVACFTDVHIEELLK